MEGEEKIRLPDGRFMPGQSAVRRPPKYESPEHLWTECFGYFHWVQENPLMEAKLITYEGEGKLMDVPKMRAMTIGGLCIHLGVTERAWQMWRAKDHPLADIVAQVDQIIRTQKFEGAAADLLNPLIIARELGLADRHEQSGPNGGPIEHSHTGTAFEILESRIAGLAARSAADRGNEGAD
jgi:hypothetical protein